MALYFKWCHSKSNDFGEIVTTQITVLVADDLLQMCKFGPCNFRCCQCAMNCQLHYTTLCIECWCVVVPCKGVCIPAWNELDIRNDLDVPKPGTQTLFGHYSSNCMQQLHAAIPLGQAAWHLESVDCWGQSVPVQFSASVILCEDEPHWASVG